MALTFLNSILNGPPLVPSLNQTVTNGVNAVLGTLDAPQLPQFLTNNPLPNGFPWGSSTDLTNPYSFTPSTGVIRAYDFTIARGFKAPDGVNRSVILVNGQFPAPPIEANWGDTFQITVHNKITGPEEGTSLHWHGILQKGHPWMDGVPSVQQCPIAPGSSFTYTFQADLYGTSWYHSHYSAQYNAGLLGSMTIHGPSQVPYDIDVGPILLTDWYHTDYFTLVEQTVDKGGPGIVFSDNNLINGKMDFNCSNAPSTVSCKPNAGISKFNFKSGKKHRLRLINAGSEGIQRFRIDGYKMTVFANDFVPIKPYDTNVVTLGIGQRSDVIIDATHAKPTDAVWMRSDLSPHCDLALQPYALAAIYFEKANTNARPNTTDSGYDDSYCGNDNLTLTTPFVPIPAPLNPYTQEIKIDLGLNGTGFTVWTMNGVSFRANYNNPLLLLANQGNTSYPHDPEWNVYNFQSNSSIRLVVRNYVGAAHPMHLHGHNFQVVSEGPGDWNGVLINSQNPQRRDVQIIPPGSEAAPSHLVLEYTTDNPGVWPFHCHIAWHVSAGLYVNLMEQPKKIQTELQIPSIMAQTCRDWSAYTGVAIPDQIDSGL
ncbi:hypothetical protein MMC25_000702 [Agyrium rufum]|nr:hypothetical protein [Agyrium rufum]